MIIDCLPDFEGNIIVNINVVSTPEAQVSNHSLFSRITQTAYEAQKATGKKTLRAYLWMLESDAYDQAQG